MQMLPGKFPSSLAQLMPRPVATPLANAVSIFALEVPLGAARLIDLSADAFAFVLLVVL